MTSSVRFGRVAGIEVGAHWTWLLVAALVVWSLAAGVFPQANPGLGGTVYTLMAIVAAALFFASLLAHELGHALQARRDGVAVDGITLWALGGVARFAGQLPSAGAELRIALAGPAVSLLIGAACVGAASLLALPAAVDGVLSWLGYINLFLLAFNLLPAFPLDGGRVVRALLWHQTGSLPRATAWAAGAGRGFGVALIAVGFVLAVLAGALSGLWLALLGFFLLQAAGAELETVRAQHALSGLRVADVMVRDPVCVPAELPLDRFVDEVFLAHRHTAYPVLADDAVAGLVSFRDVVAAPRQQWPQLRVADRMRPLHHTLVLDADRALADVIGQLAQDPLHRALVRRPDHRVGLLSVTDAARVLDALASGELDAASRADVPADPLTARPRSPIAAGP
jgi:Zn-dependent protease